MLKDDTLAELETIIKTAGLLHAKLTTGPKSPADWLFISNLAGNLGKATQTAGLKLLAMADAWAASKEMNPDT